MSAQKYEYRVRSRRIGQQEQARVYQRGYFAHRRADRLTGFDDDDRPDLAPLEYVRVERREVGPWTMPWGDK